MSRIRDRALFLTFIVILLALTVLRTALHLAGAAIRVILIAAAMLIATFWISSRLRR